MALTSMFSITKFVMLTETRPIAVPCFLIIVTVPGKRDQLGNFFKIELLLQQERVGFELQNALHIL